MALANLMARSLTILLLLFSGVFMIPFVVAAPNTASGGQQLNAAWSFQNSIWGTEVAGSSQIGPATMNYVATYNNNAETETFSAPGVFASQVFVVTRLTNGSFQLSSNEGTGSIVNKYTPTAPTGFQIPPGYLSSLSSGSGPQPLTSQYQWQQGTIDKDNPTFNIIGATVYYTFSGGSYYSTSNTLAIWLYVDTNTGQFIQVVVAWGSVNCGQTATSAPIFSYGYGSHLSQCPVATATSGHTYEMSIQYYAPTNQWYIEIFDFTSSSYVLSTYVSVSGTSVSPDNFGVVMEGICLTSTSCPWGMNIPNTQQSFGPNGFNYATACNPNYSCANNWVNYAYYSSSAGGSWLAPPPDLQYYVRAPSGYISQVVWY